MPLQVTNTIDNSLVHQNNYVAEDFNTPQLVEAAREINLSYGDGQLKHWYFDGIRMAYSLWKYKGSQSIAWKTSLDVVTIYFSLKGRITMDIEEFEKQYTFSSGQLHMFYTANFNGLFTNHELLQETFIMQFTKNAFIKLAETGGPIMQGFADKLVKGQPILPTEENLYMDVAMYDAIRQILNCNYKSPVKKMFLHSKCLEILAAYLNAMERAGKNEPVYCKTDYDRERILFARDYLLQHMDMPPNLSELSHIAGINEFKLKRGFKEMFNSSVFGYLAEHRLLLAKHDILAGKRTATEIAFELGYASPQHFSTAYKKRFGISPKNQK